MQTLADVNPFHLNETILRSRWASLILAIVYASANLPVPSTWLSATIKPTDGDFAAYHARLQGVVAKWNEAKFRHHVLSVLKVRV